MSFPIDRHQYVLTAAGDATLDHDGAAIHMAKHLNRETGEEALVGIKIFNIYEIEDMGSFTKQLHKAESFDHENIVKVHRSFMTDEDQKWVIMSPPGIPIRSILRSCFRQGLPENAIACILKETLKALHYMHEEEEVCGNIGAGSVFLDDCYRVRITSSITPENRRSRDAVDLGYMSDYGVGVISKATDTLMFGFLALELFYGEVPSSEEFSLLVANEFGKKQQKRRRFRIKFRVLSCFRGERERKIPTALAEVMAACLCRDEKARPTTAELMEFSLFQTTFVGDLSLQKLMTKTT